MSLAFNQQTNHPASASSRRSTSSASRLDLRKMALVLALFILGAVAGWLTRSSPSSAEPADRPMAGWDALSKKSRLSATSDEAPSLAQGDQLFREDRFDLALAIYQQLASADPAASLAFRIALCQEHLGDWQEALKRYQDIVGGGAFAQAQAAHLSQARVHLRHHRPGEAKALLWPFLLRGGHGGRTPLLSESAHLLALALGQEQLARRGPAQSPELVFPADLPWQTQRYLDWLGDEPPRTEEPMERIVLGPAEGNLDRTVEEAFLGQARVVDVVEQLAQAAQISVRWTDAARAVVEARVMALNTRNLSLLSILHGIADSVELVCEADEEAIRFALPTERNKESLLDVRHHLARRLLAEIVQRDPRHCLAPAVHLLLGNLEAGADATRALAWYERLHANLPFARENHVAHFNRALLLQREGNGAEARQAYYLVVDHAPSHSLAGKALLRLGQMALEEGDHAKSLLLLKRAAAQTPHARSALLASLAVAYTLNDQADQVRTLLAGNREHFQDDLYHPYAAFLNAYARFRQSSLSDSAAISKPAGGRWSSFPRTGKAVDSDALLLALLALPERTPLDNLGRHVVGLAFCDLGLWDQARAIYEQIVAEEKGPLLHEGCLRLADALDALGDRKKARELYTTLALEKSLPATFARHRLAGMELEDDRPNACLERCRRLLDEPSSLDRGQILFMMGQAHERLGEFDKAVKCYTGELP